VRICASCGREAPKDFSFCPGCGAALTDDAQSGARRTVTILFSDIVGSTQLGERLDPERLQIVLTRYFHVMRIVIERHGGTVEKFIGDAVMAVFGVPRVREDDALRAVRAAAEMGEALDELNAELETTHGVRILVRTGVNTGGVMVADQAQGTLASGDAVNVAARLEQAAGPGEILIGDATHHLVCDAVMAEPREPLSVKGKSEPLLTYRVLKVDPEASGFARRLDAPMVGRARELALLESAFERTVSDHACQLFTVLGVGGVGKSRLVEAFVDALGERATVLRGRCPPYGDGITFLPVVEAIRQATGLSGVEDPDEARRQIAALVGPDEHSDRIAHQVGQVLGLQGAEASQEDTLWAIRRLVESLANERPVVFLVDDVQWAEPTMLDLIEHIADWSVDAPILLSCMARPELLEVRPEWGGGKLNATTISLEPLTGPECQTLVANLLATDDVAPQVRERIAEAAEGHPLFAEEMLAMLVEEGRVEHVDGVWTSAGDLAELSVPPTTSALLSARIDRLDPADRAVLERASVIGQTFYREALAEGDQDVGRHLSSLMRKQFIHPDRSDLAGVEALAFRHLLIRDAAYDGLPKAARAEQHEWFAGWLEERAPEQHELAGYHLEQAHRYLEELGIADPRVVELAARAAAHLQTAGGGSLDRGDMPATVSLLTRAASLMAHDGLTLVPVLLDLAMGLAEAGELTDALAAAARAERIAQERSEEVLAARARICQRWISYWGHVEDDEVGATERFARESISLFERAGDLGSAGLAWSIIGSTSWSRCRADEAEPAWRRAVELFDEAGDRRMADDYRGWLASVQVWGPTPCGEALGNLHVAAEGSSGRPMAELAIGSAVATVRVMLGELEEARRRFEETDRDLRERGRRLARAHNSQEMGYLELMSGNASESARILGEGEAELRGMGSDAARIISAMRGQSLYACGRYDEADEAASRAITGGGYAVSEEALARGVRAMVAARRGSFEEGERLAREALAVIDESDFLCDRADARIALAEVLQLSGRQQEAAVAVREAIALYEAKGNVLQAGHAHARLDSINP
jgi:class 3 adenylate cyclase/tetratricopeptide (TPR) repeat protein